MSRRGLVLFAHGARDPRWALPFEAVARRARGSLPDTPVRLAFLELMQPGLAEAVASLAGEGVTDVDVVPLFLGGGGHLRNDLPRLTDAVRSGHPGLNIRLHPAVGEDEAVVEAMAQAAIRFSGE